MGLTVILDCWISSSNFENVIVVFEEWTICFIWKERDIHPQHCAYSLWLWLFTLLSLWLWLFTLPKTLTLDLEGEMLKKKSMTCFASDNNLMRDEKICILHMSHETVVCTPGVILETYAFLLWHSSVLNENCLNNVTDSYVCIIWDHKKDEI